MRRLTGLGVSNTANRVEWLERTLPSLPAGRILDAGCGEQQFRRLCGQLEYVGQDFAKYDGQGDGAAFQTGTFDQTSLDIVSDICAIPEPDESFDAVMCTEVFEHIPQPVDALREFARLLRPEGRLVLTAPFSSLTHFSPYYFSTGFSRYWYTHHLAECGFEILEISPNGNFFEFVAQEILRIPKVASLYSSRLAGWCAAAAAVPLLPLLAILSKLDRGSSESLCFGFNVLARKLPSLQAYPPDSVSRDTRRR